MLQVLPQALLLHHLKQQLLVPGRCPQMAQLLHCRVVLSQQLVHRHQTAAWLGPSALTGSLQQQDKQPWQPATAAAPRSKPRLILSTVWELHSRLLQPLQLLLLQLRQRHLAAPLCLVLSQPQLVQAAAAAVALMVPEWLAAHLIRIPLQQQQQHSLMQLQPLLLMVNLPLLPATRLTTCVTAAPKVALVRSTPAQLAKVRQGVHLEAAPLHQHRAAVLHLVHQATQVVQAPWPAAAVPHSRLMLW